MPTPCIAVLGAGNMGSALISGLIQDKHPPDKIWAYDINESSLENLRSRFQIHITHNYEEAILRADAIILAVKPQQLAALSLQITSSVQAKKPLVISIAAGIPIAHLQEWLGEELAIVRAMPNTPALIGCGATGLFANHHVNPIQHELAESILRAVGVIVWLKQEEEMNAVTALSGSGPAYFFLVMEALEEAATQLGLSQEIAHLLLLQTALGSVRMAIEANLSLKDLRQQVTSPQGTTEKALSVLENNHIRRLFKEALLAAKLRAEELGKN